MNPQIKCVFLLVCLAVAWPASAAPPASPPSPLAPNPREPQDHIPEVVPLTPTQPTTLPAPVTVPTTGPAKAPLSKPSTPVSTATTAGSGPASVPATASATATAYETSELLGERPMVESLKPGSKLFGFKLTKLAESGKENLLEQFFKKNLLENKENFGAAVESIAQGLESQMAIQNPDDRAKAVAERLADFRTWLDRCRSDKEMPAELADFCALFMRLRQAAQPGGVPRSVRQATHTALQRDVGAYVARFPKQPWGPLLMALTRDLSARQGLACGLDKPAMEYLAQASGLSVKDAQLHFVLGNLYRDYLDRSEVSGFLKQFATEFEKCLMLQRRNKELFAELTAAYVEIHEAFQKREAQEPFWFEELVYRRIIALDPSNASAHNNLSFLYSQYGVNLKDALREAQVANQLKPNDPLLLDTLGWAQYKNGNLDKAVEVLKQALALNKEVADIHFHLATVYYDLSDVENASLHFRETMRLEPENAFARNNLAYLYAEKDVHLDDGLVLVDQALERQPDNAAFIDTKGWIYFKQGKLDLAIEHLKKAVELSPDTSELHLHLGKVYMLTREFEKAIKCFESALTYDPDNSKIARELSYLFALGGLRESMDRYARIGGVSANKENFKVFFDAMAQAAISAGDSENAARLLHEYAKFTPKAPTLLATEPAAATTAARPLPEQLEAVAEMIPADADLVLSVERPGLSKLVTFFAKAVTERYGLALPLPAGLEAIPPRVVFALRYVPAVRNSEFLVIVEMTSPVFQFYWNKVESFEGESQELTVPIGQMTVPLSLGRSSYKGVTLRSVTLPQGQVHFALSRPYGIFSLSKTMLTSLIDRIEAHNQGLRGLDTYRAFTARQKAPCDVTLFLPFQGKDSPEKLPAAYQATFRTVRAFGAAYTVPTTDQLTEQSIFFPTSGTSSLALCKSLQDLVGTIRKDIADRLSPDIHLDAKFTQEGEMVLGEAKVTGFAKLVSEMLSTWYKTYLPSLDLTPQPPKERNDEEEQPVPEN